MPDLDLDAIEARAKVASAGRLNWQGIDALRSLVESDVPALVAALREARTALLDPDGDLAWQIASAHDAKVTEEFMAEGGKACCNAHGYKRERDDWRRRYEGLRDAVLALCDEAERRADPGVRLWSMPEARIKTSDLRAVVVRVEGDES